MNLYFRMLLIFIKIWLGSRTRALEESVVQFRVFLTDCDVYFHLTGARYLGLTDLGRLHLLGQMGILGALLERRWFPINNATEITFIRPIKLFQKFRLVTRVVTWDDKYWYTEHRFEVAGQLHAVSLVRGVFVSGRHIVPVGDIVALTGENIEPPPGPDFIQYWKQWLSVKKHQFFVAK